MTRIEEAIKYFEQDGDEVFIPFAEPALVALRAQQERENPKPLTLEQIGEMNGDIAFMVDDAKEWRGWVEIYRTYEYCGRKFTDVWHFGNEVEEEYRHSEYGKSWKLYAHKPKEQSASARGKEEAHA